VHLLVRFVKDSGSNHLSEVFQALISFFFQGFLKSSETLRTRLSKYQLVADVVDNQHFERNVKRLFKLFSKGRFYVFESFREQLRYRRSGTYKHLKISVQALLLNHGT